MTVRAKPRHQKSDAVCRLDLPYESSTSPLAARDYVPLKFAWSRRQQNSGHNVRRFDFCKDRYALVAADHFQLITLADFFEAGFAKHARLEVDRVTLNPRLINGINTGKGQHRSHVAQPDARVAYQRIARAGD